MNPRFARWRSNLSLRLKSKNQSNMRQIKMKPLVFLLITIFSAFAVTFALGQEPASSPSSRKAAFREDRVIVKLKPGKSPLSLRGSSRRAWNKNRAQVPAYASAPSRCNYPWTERRGNNSKVSEEPRRRICRAGLRGARAAERRTTHNSTSFGACTMRAEAGVRITLIFTLWKPGKRDAKRQQ